MAIVSSRGADSTTHGPGAPLVESMIHFRQGNNCPSIISIAVEARVYFGFASTNAMNF